MADYVLSVKVTGDEKEFVKALEKAGATFENLENTVKNTGLDSFSDKLKGIGSSMKQVGSKMSSTFTKPVLAAGTALAGVTLAKGWARMTEIDSAKVKLEAIGLTATQVQKVTDNALASVKGTAYSMADAMTTAASATAAGIKPGKDLQKYLTQVADAAAVAGADMSEMGSIFNKVATQGKANNEVLQQLAEKGIPIYQWLADEIGVTAEEVFDLASRGKIDLATFRKAVESNIGGAAKTMGSKTITGAIANMWAAISRVGQAFLGAGDDGNSFAGKLIPLINKMTDGLDSLAEKAGDFGATFGQTFGAVINYLDTGSVAWQGMNDDAREAFKTVQPLLDQLRQVDWAETFKTAGMVVRKAIIPLIAMIGSLVSIFAQLPEGVQGFILAALVLGGPVLSIFGTIASVVGTIGGKLGGLAGKAKPLDDIGSKSKAASPKVGALGKNLITMAGAVALLGVGIAAAAAGFYLMAQAATTLTASGGATVAVFFGMIAAFAGLIALLGAMGPLSLAAGGAVLMLGAGLALAGVGALLLANALKIAVAQLPKIGKNGPKAAQGITAIGNAAGQLKLTQVAKLAALALEFNSLGKSCTKVAAGFKAVTTATKSAGNAVKSFGASASSAITSALNKLNSFKKAFSNIGGKKTVTIGIKVPHVTVSWTKSQKGDSTAWIPHYVKNVWATGAIFNGPSLLRGGNLVGEAGPEAVAPISTLQSYVTDAVVNANQSADIDYAKLGQSVAEALMGIDFITEVNLNDKTLAEGIAKPVQKAINQLQARQNRKLGYI